MKDSRETIETNLAVLFDMLSKGQFVEAQEKFFHEDVTLVEGNADPKQGKEHCIAVEKEVLSGVAEFIGYTVSGHATSEGRSYYEAVMEYVENSGNRVRVEQAVVSDWEDGQIVKERFYHA